MTLPHNTSDVIIDRFASFIGCAIFGRFISLIIVAVMLYFHSYSVFTGAGKHTLWIIPVVWGILGLFWYERMLDIGRDIVEGMLRLLRLVWDVLHLR